MDFKIDVTGIIAAHRRSIVNANTNRPAVSDWVSFVVLPVAFSAILMSFKVYLDSDLVNTIISAFSIFVGLLLNVIVVLFDIIRSTSDRKIKLDVLEETLANISFAIVLALFCIMFSFTTQIKRWDWVSPTANAINYYLLGLFITTLLMIIKRMYALFYDEINEAKKRIRKLEEDEYLAELERKESEQNNQIQ
ncbi:hypothetical protein [Hymenobacter sp. AT01-02]|uniref:hypothetical protein n=1 Tax=Hymenobacter sp. AT01-02 TaxID=1571877 RepID=UPI0006E33546|nr:hypothetical protein [Hymenobacter sp. AT01-02]